MKKYTLFRPRIFSRHPSHSPLRRALALLPFKSCVRFGSTTRSTGRISCNTVEAVRVSASKLLMKNAFEGHSILTALWYTFNGVSFEVEGGVDNEDLLGDLVPITEITYPIVAKHIHGSRGTGNYLLKTPEEYND